MAAEPAADALSLACAFKASCPCTTWKFAAATTALAEKAEPLSLRHSEPVAVVGSAQLAMDLIAHRPTEASSGVQRGVHGDTVTRRRPARWPILCARRHLPVIHHQLTDRDWQREAPGPGAAGVDEQHTVALLHQRFVRVTGYHHAHTGGRWVNVQLAQIMDHIQPHTTQLYQLGFRAAPAPRGHGRCCRARRSAGLLSQLAQHARLADVTGVHDVVAALQEGQCLRAQQVVGVGDQAYAHGGIVAAGSRPRGWLGAGWQFGQGRQKGLQPSWLSCWTPVSGRWPSHCGGRLRRPGPTGCERR